MIHNLETDRCETRPHADVCIVGAGAAGIALAVELKRLGRSVLLLEGGGRLVEERAQIPYVSEIGGLPYRGLQEGRVRALGGTTTKWGGQSMEFDPLNFETRPWISCSGWPFAKTELTPYYQRAIQVEGLEGALREDNLVWAALGMEQPQLAPLCISLSRWCLEPNFALLHKSALEGDGIEVWLHANAVQLLLDGEQVRGVRCRTQGDVEAVFTAAEYCFCLGAIESSRFFLQPREGGLPWNSSGLLGMHFQDHVDCTAATVKPLPGGAFHANFDTVFLHGYKYNPKLTLDEATQRTEGLLQAGATFFSEDSDVQGLTRLKGTAKKLLRGRFGEIDGAEAWELLRNGPLLARHGYRYAVKHRAYHARKAPMQMRVHCEQEPCGDSRITLSDVRDELGLLRTRIQWRLSDLELRTIRCLVQVAQSALAGVARVQAVEDLADPGLARRCEDSFHHMGGMRMGSTEHSGVVDPNLRLFGTANAYVCSSAVFPCSGFSNPTHTLLALAMRLAERLAR